MFYDLNVPYAADDAEMANTLSFLAERRKNVSGVNMISR